MARPLDRPRISQDQPYSRPGQTPSANATANVKAWECGICDITYFTCKGYDVHLQSAQHRAIRATIPAARDPSPEISARPPPPSAATPFRPTEACSISSSPLAETQGGALARENTDLRAASPSAEENTLSDDESSTGTETSDEESRISKQRRTISIRAGRPLMRPQTVIVDLTTPASGSRDVSIPANAVASSSTVRPAPEPIPLVPPRIPERRKPPSTRRLPLESRHSANGPPTSDRNGREPRRPFRDSDSNAPDPSEAAYGCAHCPQSFVFANRLITHIRDEHQDIKRYVCSGCNTPFATAARFREHLVACSMGGRPSSRSPVPELSVARVSGDDDVRQSAPNRRRPREPDSDVIRANRNERSRSSATPIDTPSARQQLRYKYYCPPPCDRVYKSMDTLTQHRAKYHPSAKFNCTTCHDEFTTGQKLKNHLVVNPRHMQIGLAKPSLVPVTGTQQTRKKPKIGTVDAPIKLESDSDGGSEDDMPRVEFVRATSMAPKRDRRDLGEAVGSSSKKAKHSHSNR